jgi:hypothetical protein
MEDIRVEKPAQIEKQARIEPKEHQDLRQTGGKNL